MRRRLLLGEGEKEYVFSAATTSRSVSYTSGSTSINIKSTANGENAPYVVYSYDGVVTAVTTAATSVTIRYSENTTLSSRSGTVKLKQSESEKTITIDITQSGAILFVRHEAIILDGANSSTGSTTLNVTESGTVTSKPSWANVTYSNGNISVTATSANSATTTRTSTTTITISGQTITVTIIQMPNSYSSVDGYEYITVGDLKWAIKNVGASSITSYGQYYKGLYYQSGEEDIATKNMGGSWRMPTQSELTTLKNKTSYFSSYKGVNGIAFYDSSTSQCIYFPCAGYYSYVGGDVRELGSTIYIWSSTDYQSSDYYHLYANKGYKYVRYEHSGSKMSVRGVHA